MRFSTTLIIHLVSSTFALPLILPRDDTVVKYNINRVGAVLSNLASTLARRKPGPRDDRGSVDAYFKNALNENDRVISEIQDSAQDIRRSRNKLTDFEAAQLAFTRMGQESTLGNIVNHWIDVKRDARDFNHDRHVLDGLLRIQYESNRLSDALIDKQSNIAQGPAKGLKAKFSAQLDRAIKEYRLL
jgi:hypothetical protein